MKTRKLNSANAPEIEFSGLAMQQKANKFETINASLIAIKRLKWFLLSGFVCILYSCNNSDQLVQQYKTLHNHDSALMAKTQADDSTIKAYINSMNAIQSNLDEIKSREKILSVQNDRENATGTSAVEDIKALDKLIIKSNAEIAALHVSLKKMNVKNAGLDAMVERMTAQLSEKDSEIVALQNNLAAANNSYAAVTNQFNDSLTVLQARNTRIENMTNDMNTVYYAIGTLKELKDNKVIAKTGGFIGIGKNMELTPDKNTSYFTKTDETKLRVIPLNAKFRKLLTTHPAESYKITGNKTADSLVITDASAFWSENKYLVVAIK